MDRLQEAIALNNNGVQHLQDGISGDGIESFQRAAVIMKAYSDQAIDWPQTSLFGHNHKAGFSFGSAGPGGQSKVHCDQSYVYNRPLIIVTDLDGVSEDHLQWFVLTATTSIIFNLALSWHLHGNATGKSMLLTKASHLYNLVINVIDNAETVDESYAVLECVALNNLAQIHFEQGNYDICRDCLSELFDLIQMNDFLDIYLDSEEADEIRFNILHLRAPVAALAA